jgi:CRP/FNR family transcriptional regulator, transcriptional activator FtrB
LGSHLRPVLVDICHTELAASLRTDTAIDHRGFARAITRQLAQAQRASILRLKSADLPTSVERVAAWIVENHERQGSKGTVLLPFRKDILASHLNISPAQLSRTFSVLSDYGVTSEGTCIYVDNPQALYSLASPFLL